MPKNILTPLIFVLLLVCSNNAAAEESARGALQSMIAAMKTSSDFTTLTHYVDWDSALTSLPAEERTRLNIKNGEDMREFFQMTLKNPVELVKRRFPGQLAALPPEQKAMLEGQMAGLGAMLKGKIEEEEDKLRETEFIIQDVQENGTSAKARLLTRYRDKEKPVNLSLVRKNNKWLLSSPGLIKTPEFME
ncbi:MAG: hypothetical protein PHC51_09980 [bacterium]|nr:hypothetical protein [bacterium]